MGFYVGDFARNMVRETFDPARLSKPAKSAAKKVETKLEPHLRRMTGETLQLSRPATNRAYEILKGLK